MRHESKQLDVFRDDPTRLASIWRTAAETALHDIQFTDDERQRRHDYYLAEANKIQRSAR